MSVYQILGGTPLEGTVSISGAKNSSLILHAAALLATSGTILLQNVPDILDTYVMCDILNDLGVDALFQPKTAETVIRPSSLRHTTPSENLVRQIRASVTLIGPLLARAGYVRIPFPGGDAIGSRSIDLHLRGFQAMGATCVSQYGTVEVHAPASGLRGASYYLDFPTVNGTENLMMAACLAKGTTVLQNAAKEPEIVDLANLLNAMGASIRGAGTETIVIEGVRELKGVTHCVIPDRLEAGTYLIAGAMTGGRVFAKGAIREHLKAPLAKMREMGLGIEDGIDGIGVYLKPGVPIKATSFHTRVYPGIPTDLQAPLMALLTQANGTAVITENIFENRFHHVSQLNRLGADIRTSGSKAFVTGKTDLTGATLQASDIRAGAALVCAGLAANGVTTIQQVHHIERGYVSMISKLRSLGAQVRKIDSDLTQVQQKLTV